VKAMDSASERKSNDCRVAIAAMPTDRPNAGVEPESVSQTKLGHARPA